MSFRNKSELAAAVVQVAAGKADSHVRFNASQLRKINLNTKKMSKLKTYKNIYFNATNGNSKDIYVCTLRQCFLGVSASTVQQLNVGSIFCI